MPVTAILLNWARPHNIPRIAAFLNDCPIINQVIVWDNSKKLPESPLYERVTALQNVYTMGRLLASKHAENDELYFQDDDILVGNILRMYDYWQKQPEKIVAGLAHEKDLRHWELEAHKVPWLQLGWGSFHRKEWLTLTDEYIVRHGEDELLRRKWDRIYTTIHGGHAPVKAKIFRLRNPGGGYSDSDQSSLWLKTDHQKLTTLAVARALEIRASMQSQA